VEPTQNTTNNFVKKMRIVFFAMIAGQVLFAAISLYLHFNADPLMGPNRILDLFIYVAPVLIVASYFLGNILFNVMKEKGKSSKNSLHRQNTFRAAYLVRFAFIEGASLFTILLFLLTNNFIFLGMTGVCFLLCIRLIPNNKKVIDELELTPEEFKSLNRILVAFK